MTTEENTADTILVVDDTESNIDILLRILDDYDLIPCTSGDEALALLHSETVDLILLDIVMPGMDGFEVCRRLKANPATRDIPIVFITARDDARSLETAYEIGGYDYVTKPFNPNELRVRVRTQLTLYRQFNRLKEQNRELVRARQALTDSEQRYRLAMEASTDGLWDWNLSNGQVFYSPGWFRIVDERDPGNGYATWEARIHPDDKERVLGSLQAHLDGSSDAWAEEHRLRKRDGSWAWVMGRGRVVQRSVNGSPLRMVGTMIDIGERKQVEELGKLKQQLSELVYSADLEELMRTALDNAERLTCSEIGFYHFVEEDQETVSLQIWSTRTLKEMCFAEGQGLHYPVSLAGVWVDCIHQRQVVVHNEYSALTHKKGLPEGHPEIQRELTVPVFREGRIVAVMGVGNKPRHYDARDRDVVSLVADMTQDFVERKRAEQRIEFMAFNDVLTGLPNRELLLDRLKQAISVTRRSDRLLAVCYLDLDGFKPVNDRYGHHLGDVLLIKLAERLSQELRSGDTLARLGGDEFAILLNGLHTIFDGESIVSRILESIRQPFDIDDHHILVSGSIGVTFCPPDKVDADTLLRHADQAMYKAKDAGKSVFRLFDPVQEHKVRTHRRSLQEFERALRDGQLTLFYQPRVDLSSGKTVSAEALLRWHHPEKGLLPPDSFLPLVEGTPLEIALGEWVLQTALKQHREWVGQGLKLPVSINVSPRHICLHDFSRYLERLLSDYPAGMAKNLELEVLETTAVSDTACLVRAMADCAKLGVHFSLDDFGTGYASLTHFHQLPIDVLKIDRNFVKDMLDNERDLDIVEGVLRLAYGLKRPVVAEGVESLEIGMMLLQLGCRYAQGFGIAKPMPADEVPGWLAQWTDNNVWHRLHREAKGRPEQFDLNVSIFSHRHWLEQVTAYIESDGKQTLPVMDGKQCQFERWYRGIGLIRYGSHPSYPFIPPKHGRVHDLANALVAQKKGTRDAQRTQAGLAELQSASKELIQMLERLQG